MYIEFETKNNATSINNIYVGDSKYPWKFVFFLFEEVFRII